MGAFQNLRDEMGHLLKFSRAFFKVASLDMVERKCNESFEGGMGGTEHFVHELSN